MVNVVNEVELEPRQNVVYITGDVWSASRLFVDH
jgi:hypothetical protein